MPATQAKLWYYANGDVPSGPLEEGRVIEFLRKGQLPDDTLLWTEGLPSWTPARATTLAQHLEHAGGGSARSLGAFADDEPAEQKAEREGRLIQVIQNCFYKGYVKFEGRSSRTEWAYFSLFVVLINLLFGSFAASVETTMFREVMTGSLSRGDADIVVGLAYLPYVCWQLAAFLPSLAVIVRRLHDTGRSGWLVLVALAPIFGWIVLLVWLCGRPTPGPNRFG